MKALETIKDHIKDLERMEGVFTFYDCFNSASECKKATKELTEAVAEIEALQSRSCDGCKYWTPSWENENFLNNKRLQNNLEMYIRSLKAEGYGICSQRSLENINKEKHKNFCCNKHEPKE